MSLHFALSFWVCMMPIVTLNLSNLNDDSLRSVLFCLPNEERVLFRCINKKSNHIFKMQNDPTIESLKTVQTLLKDFMQAPSSRINLMFRLSEINRHQRLNEQYCLSLPSLIYEQLKLDNQSRALSSIKKSLSEFVITYPSFDDLDDATKILILSSRKIATRLATNIYQANALKLLYEHCWDYVSSQRDSLLPPFDSIFYLTESSEIELKQKQLKYLNYLMDEFGLAVLHQKDIELCEIEWNNDTNLSLYMDQHFAVESDQIMFSDDMCLLNSYQAEWVFNLLHNVNKDNFQRFMDSRYLGGVFEEFECELLLMMEYFYDNDANDVLKTMLFALKRVNGLSLLDNLYDFLDAPNDANADRWINFISMFCQVVSSMSPEKCKIIAKSIYLWRMNNNTESVRVMDDLMVEPMFEPGIWSSLQAILRYPLINDNSAEYCTVICSHLVSAYRIWLMDRLTNDSFTFTHSDFG